MSHTHRGYVAPHAGQAYPLQPLVMAIKGLDVNPDWRYTLSEPSSLGLDLENVEIQCQASAGVLPDSSLGSLCARFHFLHLRKRDKICWH